MTWRRRTKVTITPNLVQNVINKLKFGQSCDVDVLNMLNMLTYIELFTVNLSLNLLNGVCHQAYFIHLLNTCTVGCHINNVCADHLFYADNWCIISPGPFGL